MEKGFCFVGRHKCGFLQHFKVYYSPSRFVWAIEKGSAARYFDTAKAALDYAVSQGWVKQEDVLPLLLNMASHEIEADDLFYNHRQETPEKSLKQFFEVR